eukprot:11158811-Lingulodinium_polyedra.AAC.1
MRSNKKEYAMEEREMPPAKMRAKVENQEPPLNNQAPQPAIENKQQKQVAMKTAVKLKGRCFQASVVRAG